MATIRAVSRLTLLVLCSFIALLDYTVCGSWRSAETRFAWQSRWTTRWTRWAIAIMGIRLTIKGNPPPVDEPGLVLPNHLSYADIFCLGAATPVIYVSNDGVKKWPLGGWLAEAAGTVYIRRMRRSELPRVAQEIGRRIDGGASVALFLEGTTTDGTCLLPMSGGLLESAVREGWPVTPVYQYYRSSETGSADGVAWVGDTPFMTHLMTMLGTPRIELSVCFGEQIRGTDRRELLAAVRDTIKTLGGKELGLDGPLLDADTATIEQTRRDTIEADKRRAG